MNVFFVDPFLQTNHTHVEIPKHYSLFHSFIVHFQQNIKSTSPKELQSSPLWMSTRWLGVLGHQCSFRARKNAVPKKRSVVNGFFHRSPTENEFPSIENRDFRGYSDIPNVELTD